MTSVKAQTVYVMMLRIQKPQRPKVLLKRSGQHRLRTAARPSEDEQGLFLNSYTKYYIKVVAKNKYTEQEISKTGAKQHFFGRFYPKFTAALQQCTCVEKIVVTMSHAFLFPLHDISSVIFADSSSLVFCMIMSFTLPLMCSRRVHEQK